MQEKFLKKLASKLIFYTKTEKMQSILEDYSEFVYENDFDETISQTVKSLNLKYWKIVYFIVISYIFVFGPFYFLYFRPYTNIIPYSYIIINVLSLIFPAVLSKLYGKKLTILGSFHKKSRLSIILTTFMYIIINSAIIFISSGIMIEMIIKISEVANKYIQFYWEIYHIFINLGFFITFILLIKLFTSGIFYFMPFCISYFGSLYFTNFIQSCSLLTEVSMFKNIIIMILVPYILGCISSLIFYLKICKEELNESSI